MDLYREKRKSRIIKHIVFIIIAILLLLIITIRILTNWIVVDSTNVESFNIPRTFHNKKIIFVSDFLYNGKNSGYIKSAIYKINACRPDVVILGGNFGINPKMSMEFFDIIPTIQANICVIAVLGEYDIDKDNRDLFTVKSKLIDKNIYLLVNDVKSIRVEDKNIFVFGLDDYKIGSPVANVHFPKFKNDDYVIFVSNSYKGLNQAIDSSNQDETNQWCDLVLLGSTLGGKYFFLPSIAKSLDPINSPKYYTGWHEEKRVKILVSNGIGTGGTPFRLFVLPQIHEITLKYR